MAMVTGVNPSPTPCRARPATTSAKLSEAAAKMQPATTEPRAARTTRRCRDPSASRPITGVARAPVNKVAVSSHWAVLRET